MIIKVKTLVFCENYEYRDVHVMIAFCSSGTLSVVFTGVRKHLLIKLFLINKCIFRANLCL